MALPSHPCCITVTSKCPVLAGTWHICELKQPRLLPHVGVPSKATQLAVAQVTQGHQRHFREGRHSPGPIETLTGSPSALLVHSKASEQRADPFSFVLGAGLGKAILWEGR